MITGSLRKSLGGTRWWTLSLATILAAGVCLIPGAQTAIAGSCPNEAFRSGASAQLPDCRAYELVTPGASGQVFQDSESDTGPPFFRDLFPSEPTSPAEESVVFSTRGYGLLNPKGDGEVQSAEIYQAVRGSDGWRIVRNLLPAPDESTIPLPGGISADHRYIFVHAGPLTVSRAEGGLGSLYVDRGADYLGDPEGHFLPTGVGTLGVEQYAQGRYISPGGGHVIFTTGREADGSGWCSIVGSICKVKPLEADAAPEGTGTVYDRSVDGPTRVVSLLPGNRPQLAGEDAAYQGVSADGTTVAFTVEGTLYVRVDDEKTEEVTGAPFTFGGFSTDGRYLFYVGGGDIHRFDTTDDADEAINSSGDAAMMNVSADGSHVYFISPSQLDGSKGEPGKPNIYLWKGGRPQFVATLLQSDLEATSVKDPTLNSWTEAVSSSLAVAGRGPGRDPSRLTPDGTIAVFESAARLTPYDNAGHTEIYRFKEGEGILCVSCNPLAPQASKDARLQGLGETGPEIVLHNLSDDGSRVFFETEEALVEGDVDGINDAYEWEEGAGGEGPSLSLISSGRSANLSLAAFEGMEQNTLMGIAPDGSDVFFKSQDPLVPGAPMGNAPVIYDARVGGGFAVPEEAVPCAEEGCKPPVTPPPALASAGTSGLRGAGNVPPKRKKHPRRHRRHRRHHGRHHSARHHGPCGGQKGHRNCPGGRKADARASSASFGPPAVPPAQVGASTGTVADLLAPTPAANLDHPQTAAAVTAAEYGLESAQAELSTYAAGGHPDFTSRLKFVTPQFTYSPKTEEIVTKLPPGLYGDPTLLPRCTTGVFIGESCSIDSQVGVLHVTYGPEGKEAFTTPIFNLEPTYPKKEVARFGSTIVDSVGVYIDASVRTAGDYGITATVRAAPSLIALSTVEAVFWGDPSDPSHDSLRMTAPEAFLCAGHPCSGEQASHLPPFAFFTNPSACQPMSVGFEVASYQLPGQVFAKEAPMSPIGGCQGQPFAPSLEAVPTTDVAGAPTGLKSTLKIHQTSGPAVPGSATMREVKVTLPEGLTISASAGDGLAACSDSQVHLHEEVDAECPDASKLGSATIVSPALAQPLQGALYQRSPGGKGDQFRLWLVTDELGLHVKIPAEVRTDPATGQVTAVFAELPQVPVEEIDIDIWGGARAPLKNPDVCGTYETRALITPWSADPPVRTGNRYRIERSSDGGPCPSSAGAEKNTPEFEAGTVSPISAAYSPFVLRLQREDGSQTFGSLDATLPPGLLGRLAGVAECPAASLAAAASKSGAEEKASPSCPEGSLIGRVRAAAGAGPSPFWVQGKAYLAGPYEGAPLSVAIITPALAGPFDLGTVVVHSPLFVDPETAQITVKTGPLPRILEGVPLDLRTIAVEIDRDRFTLNGTSCDPLAVEAAETSTFADTAKLSSHFQLAECARLAFRPKLKLTLKGSTRHAGHPGLRALLTYPKRGAYANVARAQVNLPHSEFIDQANLNKTCTRPVLLEGRCPAKSIYGKAKAWTPLLDKPLEGPVYLVGGYGYKLPALVAELNGRIRVLLVGKVDSGKNKGIRNTFEAVPDAPVEKFELRLKGGPKYSLLENSEDLCARPQRAIVRFTAQNGRVDQYRPLVGNRCGDEHHKKPKHHKKSAKRHKKPNRHNGRQQHRG